MYRNSKGEVHIGSSNGKIAVWCTESEAYDMANTYGERDGFFEEMMDAIKLAYPKETDETD